MLPFDKGAAPDRTSWRATAQPAAPRRKREPTNLAALTTHAEDHHGDRDVLSGRELRLIGNLLWLGLCHAVIAMPIVLLILLSALHAVDPNLERAALGLGSSRTRVFFRVVLPIALPGVMSAALFAFLASFDELLISAFLSGVRTQTLPVRIWNSLNL